MPYLRSIYSHMKTSFEAKPFQFSKWATVCIIRLRVPRLGVCAIAVMVPSLSLPPNFYWSMMLRVGMQALRVCRQVNKMWHEGALIAAPHVLIYEHFDPQALLMSLGYSPPGNRIKRIMENVAAAGDLALMDETVFRNVVTIQVALQSFRKTTPFPHSVTLKRVIDLLVGAVGHNFEAEHPLVRKAVALLGVPDEHLGADVGDEIPRLQILWRRSVMNHLCIGSLVALFSDFIGFNKSIPVLLA